MSKKFKFDALVQIRIIGYAIHKNSGHIHLTAEIRWCAEEVDPIEYN